MSVSNQSAISQVLRDTEMVRSSSNSFDKLSKQLSTGKRHEALRDYGSSVSKIINLQGIVSTRDSYLRAIDLVSFNVESYQETLTEIDGLARQAYKATGEAAPNTSDATTLAAWRNTISITADLLMRQLGAVMNTNIGGRYIFSGNQFQSPALKDLTTLPTFSAEDAKNPQISQNQTLNSLPQGAVKFAVGETTKTITVNVNGDITAESNPEQLKMHLNSVTPTDSSLPASKIIQPDALGTINDNDTTFSIVNSGASSLEEGGLFSFTVRRTGGDISAASSVNLNGLSGANVAAGDFTTGFPPTALAFAAGETKKTITIQSNNDSDVEDAEHFAISIAANPGTYHVDSNAQVASATINDNDLITKTYLSVARTSAAAISEDSGTAHTFTITRQNEHLQKTPQVVRWGVDSDKSTTNAADFANGVIPSGTVTFLEGETSKTVTVFVSNDQKIEDDETFQIEIEGENVIQSHAEAKISNDETSFAIQPLDADKVEGGVHSFVVNRSGNVSSASVLTVDATYLLDSTAIPTQTVSFAAGETQKVVSFTSTGTLAADDTLRATISAPVTTDYTSYLDSAFTSADGKVFDATSASGTVSIVATAGSTVTEDDSGLSTQMTFQITRTDSTREEFVSYGVQSVKSDSVDSEDFVAGFGKVPFYSATDAAGVTSEHSYMFGKVAGERDPLLWEQQSVGLRDGETQNYGISATAPAFQKLIKTLVLLKSSAEERNAGSETILLDKARELVQESTTDIRQLLAENAIMVNGLATAKSAHLSFNTLTKNSLNGITDIDAAEAASKVTSLQSMVNASYSLIAKRAKMSLANFL